MDTPCTALSADLLRLTLAPESLGFADTSELVQLPLTWIGQERAEAATRFGLEMDQRDYNLFVLGEVGSGRSSLMKQAMQAVAANRAVPPDLCYLYNFEAPERPRALRMPPGQGRQLRTLMQTLSQTLQREIPLRLASSDSKAEAERIQNAYKQDEAKAYAALDAFAEARHFSLFRENGQLVFTLLSDKGHAYTEAEARALPKERRSEIEQAESALRAEIARFLEAMRPLEHRMQEALATLRRQMVKPLLDHGVQEIRLSLKKQIKDSMKLGGYLEQVQHDVLEHLELFIPNDDSEADADRREALEQLLGHYSVNLVVDNAARNGAPVLVEENPVAHTLFGSIDYQADEDVMVTDFSRIRAGSLLRAHGGFLLLHLRDLLADELVWERLRRFLRSGRVQIDEPGTALMPMAAVALEPEAVDADVKIVLIASVEQYYAVQEGDPEFARRFSVKVDFAESFLASDATRQGTAVLVAHICRQRGLPHCSAAAVARILEDAHRQVDDQTRQSALFARTEALVSESAALWRSRGGSGPIEARDVDAALSARAQRHNYPELRMREAIAEGEQLVTLHGTAIGQLNGLSQIDLGDWRFGMPMRVSARSHAGNEGLVNIEREVAMSGPIHDKGVLILHSYLTALFGHLAPLALNAAIVFEQEYSGVEGDSASCAELYALLSALSGVPLRQSIAVTGAVNQQGEVLPVGGVNEKIEGWFHVCQAHGLDGSHGVLLPARNQRHLMLSHAVQSAVRDGLFHVYTALHVRQGLELLTRTASGMGQAPYPTESVLGRAEQTLLAYRRACLLPRRRSARRGL